VKPRTAVTLGLSVAFLGTLALPATAGAVGELAYQGCIANGGANGCVDPPQDSLGDAFDLAVSPDGKSVYVVNVSGAVVHLARDPASGALTYQGCIADGGAYGCIDPPHDSLNGAVAVAVSHDGRSVYVTSRIANAVTHLTRDPNNGFIGYEGCIANAGANGCGDPPQDPLGGPTGVAVSPDDASVYVASASGVVGSLSHFIRNPNGSISYQGCIADGGAFGCIDPPQDSLNGAWGVALSPDNKSIYAASANALTAFTRNTSNGFFFYQGCIANLGANGCIDPPQDSLTTSYGAAVSPDGESVYVASANGNSVTAFSRDTTTGFIGYLGCIANGGANGCVAAAHDSLGVAEGVAVSPDNLSVYATAGGGDSISHLTRDPSSGLLGYQSCVADGGANGCVDPPQDSLDGAWGVAVSPDGRNVYVSAFNSVTTFGQGLPSGSQPAGPVQNCAGKRATIVGTGAGNKLRGTARADVIAGLGGKDKISGLRGNDLICGGPGKDRLKGGPGNDKLLGQAGADTLIGGPGKDKLKGGPGRDSVKQ
jgi:DNA-binding beta-propeller fold protein YncE